MLVEPGFELGSLVHDDATSHAEVGETAEFFTEDFVLAHNRWRKPGVGDVSRHKIHLHSELRHGKVVEDVFRPEPGLYRLIHWQMDDGARDQNVVLPGGILRVNAEGIIFRDVADTHISEFVVLARKAEAPMPLLAYRLKLSRFLWNRDELPPDHEAGREHRDYAHGGYCREP